MIFTGLGLQSGLSSISKGLINRTRGEVNFRDQRAVASEPSTSRGFRERHTRIIKTIPPMNPAK